VPLIDEDGDGISVYIPCVQRSRAQPGDARRRWVLPGFQI